MSNNKFAEFDSYSRNYNILLNESLKITGHDYVYFARNRLKQSFKFFSLKQDYKFHFLDFGCGTGNLYPIIQSMYPNISYTGIDVSSKSIEFAKKKYNNHAFHLIDDFILRDHFDFVYTNGVFHHINHSEHLNCLKQIYSLLKAGGSLCFWENNPLNIGTRIVMSFNQFDNNAKLIYHWNIISKIRELKFNNINFFSHFYLPSFLQKLRIIEHSLRHLPFGGQYVIYATK